MGNVAEKTNQRSGGSIGRWMVGSGGGGEAGLLRLRFKAAVPHISLQDGEEERAVKVRKGDYFFEVESGY